MYITYTYVIFFRRIFHLFFRSSFVCVLFETSTIKVIQICFRKRIEIKTKTLNLKVYT